MDAGETSPPESVFCHEDEEPDLQLTGPFSQPPDDHTFLGLDDFADKSDFMEEEYTVDDAAFSGPPDSQTFMDLDVQTDANHSDVVDQGLEAELEELLNNPVESD